MNVLLVIRFLTDIVVISIVNIPGIRICSSYITTIAIVMFGVGIGEPSIRIIAIKMLPMRICMSCIGIVVVEVLIVRIGVTNVLIGSVEEKAHDCVLLKDMKILMLLRSRSVHRLLVRLCG